jgi:hypothetical protein
MCKAATVQVHVESKLLIEISVVLPHLAVSREAVEDDVLLIIKLDHHVLCLPIDIPGLKRRRK